MEIQKKIKNARPRPIIGKYIRYNTRSIIDKNKKVVKEKGISMT